jgi:hypothetical protein
MAVVAVLVASFSLREVEPNPCNVRLAEEAVRICDDLVAAGHTVVIAAQWEVDLALQELGTFSEYDDATELHRAGAWLYMKIDQYDDGRYLGTKEVLEEALDFFQEYNATEFVAVANPFIHQPYVYWLARKHFKLRRQRVRQIRFDPESAQWWCRSWYQFAWQTVRLALGVRHGYAGRQEHIS